ncbi:MAG: tyrosine recombinase XerC [Candidatus Fimivivens sp.]
MPAVLNDKSKYAPFADCPMPLREFLSYILTIRGLSPRTVDAYYIELRTFLRFLKLYHCNKLNSENFTETAIIDVSNEMICGISLADIYAYLNFAHTELGNSASARARKVSALSSFYRFLSTKTLYMTDNPIKNLDRPATKRTLPKYLTLDESSNLLEIADLNDNTRDYCMLTLFLNCGMRLSELVAINHTDIRDDHTLKLLGKGNKERIIYLNKACLDAISTYLEDSKKIRRKDDALFVGQNGRRLSPRRVQQIIGVCLKNAGLAGKGYTPHKLRHTAATLMYQYGHVDVRILKEILGHANLNTTEIYTHVSNQQLEKAADSSPLAQKKRITTTSEDP